ncbi:MAG TPA: HlyD family efflux transporter periplasmic adaptor subunit [Steroidobacteraceae bacterium]|nr:HlyD family efflux transporter periplasmic adaptor subunit [Steroidobacteraceae bacterium]
MDERVATNSSATVLQRRRTRWLLIVVAAFAVAGLGAGAYWWLYARNYETTDDAYVAGDLVNVSSQVSGTVVAIDADETDFVRQGQELIKLDDTDARIALQEAEDQLAKVVRQVHTVFTSRDELTAVAAQRRADLDRAESDLERRRNLGRTGAVSAEEISHARETVDAAQQALIAAERNLAGGAALLGRTGVSDNPDVQAAARAVERAWLTLRRTSIHAPVSGYIAKRPAQLGERTTPGNPLLSIVPLERLRVEANFKEVQLERMRIGQPVKVVADLYGSAVEFNGTVAGLGLGTGAAFALLPAQNATGNWIKVVQRVPVRVALDPKEIEAHPLRIGLSTRASVDVRNASGAQLALAPRAEPVLSTDIYNIDKTEITARIEQIVTDNAPVAYARNATVPAHDRPLSVHDSSAFVSRAGSVSRHAVERLQTARK